jgi:hypothetical protein
MKIVLKKERMKIVMFLFLAATAVYGRLPVTITPRDGVTPSKPITNDEPSICGTLIAPCGDIRAILGSQGKNIAVCQHGDAIYVIYGAPTGDPNYIMAVKIAYSSDQGATWTTYGPYSGNLRRIYAGVDGCPDFCTTPEHLWFYWQEHSDLIVKFDTVYRFLPDSQYYWTPSCCVAPDNPLHLVISAWSYPNGENHLYDWVSDDGGYTWSDTIGMGVIINPIYGGNCAPVISQGPSGYVCGIYNNSVGGITNDGWPYFIESTDGGHTWLPPVKLPVPQFDTANGQFWWYEDDAQVIDGQPWVIANDINNTLPYFWLFIGGGTPGARTWQAFDLRIVGACSTYVADTLFQITPSQYGSICHDPVSGMTMITYKANGYIVQGGTNVLQNGACVGGVYTYDNGTTWHIARPMSDWQTGTVAWNDWDATETAHRLVNIGGQIFAYTVWIHTTTLNLYFERGRIGFGINEIKNSYKRNFTLRVSPTICANSCRIRFDLPNTGQISLKLYDRSGRLVDELMNTQLGAGDHEISMDTQKYPAGVYFVALKTIDGVQTEKIIISR